MAPQRVLLVSPVAQAFAMSENGIVMAFSRVVPSVHCDSSSSAFQSPYAIIVRVVAAYGEVRSPPRQ